MKIRVAAVQQFLHEPLSESTISALRSIDFVCLPEHYPLARELKNLEEADMQFQKRKAYLASLSEQIDSVVVGGTLTERVDGGFYNTCYVFDSGKEAGFYRKVNPTPREQSAGVLRGTEFKVFDVRGIRSGVLICADVLDSKSFLQLHSLTCDVVFVPTASPLRVGETVEQKYERDNAIFVEGARILGCPLVKTCGVGTTFGHPLQGRSLIATPDGILKRAQPDQENSALVLTAELEI